MADDIRQVAERRRALVAERDRVQTELRRLNAEIASCDRALNPAIQREERTFPIRRESAGEQRDVRSLMQRAREESQRNDK